MLRDEASVLKMLQEEAGLNPAEAGLYLKLLKEGSVPASGKTKEVETLLAKGMAILSGDDKRFIPVHPRLAVANNYRTWRERMVREINDRRMRTDRLILELIPVYEATIEKKLAAKGQGRKR